MDPPVSPVPTIISVGSGLRLGLRLRFWPVRATVIRERELWGCRDALVFGNHTFEVQHLLDHFRKLYKAVEHMPRVRANPRVEVTSS